MSLSVELRGHSIPITVAPAPEISDPIHQPVMSAWLSSLDPSMDLRSLELQAVDPLPDGRVYSIKFKSTVLRNGVAIPGICLLRGPIVGLLIQLKDPETREQWAVLRRFPSVALGRWMLELPTGQADEEGNVLDLGIQELEAECGALPNLNRLTNLTELAYGEGGVLYTGCGLCDQKLKLFLWNPIVDHQKLRRLVERMGGDNPESGLRLVRFDDLWRIATDGKTLSALTLLKGVQDEGKLTV
jgi:hypothetical protein